MDNFNAAVFSPVLLGFHGKWNHVVVTYETDLSRAKIFVNGSMVNVTLPENDPSRKLNTVDGRIMLSWIDPGDNDAPYGRGFNGLIDNARIYNRALTAAEVSQLYSEESGEPNMVLVQGGTLPQGSALAGQTVSAFHIARFETTWAEWKKVRTWAAANGYDIGTAGQGSGDNHPVRNVSWYDAVKWCNAKSQMEGLMPVYSVNGTTYKTGQSIPTPLATANGYRLPAETEWEWAARGGVSSQGYTYSGSNDINAVAWFSGNSDNGTKSVGTKASNELGLYDMSGNVFEFCFEAYPDGTNQNRQLKGGAWNWDAAVPAVAHRVQWAGIEWRTNNIGFRYACSIPKMVIVDGGILPQSSTLAGQKVQSFEICRTEVTWGEWVNVYNYALSNGYEMGGGSGRGENHPVVMVNWYDVLKWCNAKSQMEGLTPVYTIDGTIYKTGVYVPKLNPVANGYRLPFEMEWEWAASGGVNSQGYLYSGSSNARDVGWFMNNSGWGTKEVGIKPTNELGLQDMSGNVWEWCWDLLSPLETARVVRGGCWHSRNHVTIFERGAYNPSDTPRNFRGDFDPTVLDFGMEGILGFRLARNIGPKISISGTLPEATLNQAYAGYTFGAVGSTEDKKWSISEGALPPGMSFSANGTLSGAPTTAGTYKFTIRLESGGYWDEVEVELDVVAPQNYSEMVTIQGGKLPTGSELAGQPVATFQIGKYEVTWREWKTVRAWAIANGYTDLVSIGEGSADNHPVILVSWYESLKWCNAKSEMEGLVPVYQLNGATYRSGNPSWDESDRIIRNLTANGYRLPKEAEWEWAARGGLSSSGSTYSGSNDLDSVAWYYGNSNYTLHGVGQKLGNELGIFDMSGNVFEWCEDIARFGTRWVRGGSWNYTQDGCNVAGRVFDRNVPNNGYNNIGFRLARNIGPKISISGTLPEATLNQAYAGYTFGAVGSTGNKTWSISGGTLPPGMSFSAYGTLSGTPTTTGTYTFVIRVDAGGYWDEVEVEMEVAVPKNYAEMVTVEGAPCRGVPSSQVSKYQPSRSANTR